MSKKYKKLGANNCGTFNHSSNLSTNKSITNFRKKKKRPKKKKKKSSQQQAINFIVTRWLTLSLCLYSLIYNPRESERYYIIGKWQHMQASEYKPPLIPYKTIPKIFQRQCRYSGHG
jgi:hypothetical protein